MKKNVILFLMLGIVGGADCAASQLDQILSQYEIALQKLITAQQQTSKQQTVSLQEGSIVLATYRKILAPWVSYIQGYSRIIQSEMARNISYHQDLVHLQEQFNLYEQKAKALTLYFTSSQQPQAMDIFYNQIGSNVVQLCASIVQKISYALSTNPQDLSSAQIAYHLALSMYTSSMQITGLTDGQSLVENLSENMEALYQNASNVIKTNMTAEDTTQSEMEKLYDQLVQCYQVLADVYQASGSATQQQNMLALVTATKKQKQLYQQATSQYAALLKQVDSATQTIPLDVVHPKTNAEKITQQQQQLAQISSTCASLASLYQQAGDIAGQQRCLAIKSQLTSTFFVLSAVQQLWQLYLADQSSHSVATAPTLQKFLQSKASTSNMQEAVNNLISCMFDSPNVVGQLSNQIVLQKNSLQQLLELLQTNSIAQGSSKLLSSSINQATAQKALQALSYIKAMLSPLVDTTIVSPVASVMTSSHQLDQLFSNDTSNQLRSCIPYLPAQLGPQATWTSWAAQLLVRAGMVSSIQQALSQIDQPAKSAVPATSTTSGQGVAANNLATAAHAFALKANFTSAAQQYQQAYQAYQTLYGASGGSAQATQWYNQAMLMRTMFTATSLASMVDPQGSVTWSWLSALSAKNEPNQSASAQTASLQNIPTFYQATTYQVQNIVLEPLGILKLPISLQSMTLGSASANLTDDQQQDVLALVKAYMISQVLQGQGINFTDCFINYQLQQKPGASKIALQYGLKAQKFIEKKYHNFTGCTVLKIVCSNQQQLDSVILADCALSPVTPWYGSMATAAVLLTTAHSLVVPSSTPITVSGASYVSGNDSQLADQIMRELIFAYLCEAYAHMQQASKIMQQVVSNIDRSKPKIQQQLPINFSTLLHHVTQATVRCQALLYASDQSAYAYAAAIDPTLAANIKGIFLDQYNGQIAWMKQCLVGSPFDPNYQTLLGQINTSYISWVSMLDPQQDATFIAQCNTNIAELFADAGNLCMQTEYVDPMYPKFNQYHYATAAHYFLAAQNKYQQMNQTTQQQSLAQLIQDAYFQGASQNIALYQYAKNFGVMYQSSMSGSLMPCTFQQLLASSGNAENSGMQSAYSDVKNLLIDAAMGYQFLSTSAAKNAQSPSGLRSSGLRSSGQGSAASTSSNQLQVNPKIMNYLQSKGIMQKGDVVINYYGPDVATQILNNAARLYQICKPQAGDVADLCSTLLQAVQALYAQDFLGATGVQTGSQAAANMQAFFTALQQETSKMQNPSQAYVG